MNCMGRPAKSEQPAYGRYLSELRKSARLSQQQVAEALKVRQSTVATWERSSRPPKGDLLPNLASVLGVTIEDLLKEDIENAPPRQKIPAGRLGQTFETVAQLPRRQQTKILDVVDALLAQQAEAKTS